MRGHYGARSAPRLGLLSFPAALLGAFVLAVFAACGPRSPHDVAAAADAAGKVGVYTWLAEHDPSGLATVGLDSATVHAVAPDARVVTGSASPAGCARALREHRLVAAIAASGTPDRQRLEDCGFAIFHDDGSIVVAPR